MNKNVHNHIESHSNKTAHKSLLFNVDRFGIEATQRPLSSNPSTDNSVIEFRMLTIGSFVMDRTFFLFALFGGILAFLSPIHHTHDWFVPLKSNNAILFV